MSNEKKYTDEEIRAIVDDAIVKAKNGEKRKLTPEELDNVAGGLAPVLTTGEYITEELIDTYANRMKALNLNVDTVIILSDNLGFYPCDGKGMHGCANHHEFAYIDYWATLQKGKVRQRGEDDWLNAYSTG